MRDVDLAAGWLHVRESKTDAGQRRVKLRGALRRELAVVSTGHPTTQPDGFVFAPVVARELPPRPERITPHSLRRTFASILYAIGEDPGVVMDEMSHTDPGLALQIYRHAMRRGKDQEVALRALMDGRSTHRRTLYR